MNATQASKSAELTLIANQTVALHQAAAAGQVERCAQLVHQIFGRNPEGVFEQACPEELEVFAFAHEVLDGFLRGVLFQGAPSALLNQISFPKRGFFMAPILMANARWLRMFGSTLPDQEQEELAPERLQGQDLMAQASLIGRYCAVNDGARYVDYEAILNVLDPRLHAAFAHWLVGVALCSPINLGTKAAAENQARMCAAFIRRHRESTKYLASSALFSHLPFMYCYRKDADVRSLATIITGSLGTQMLREFQGKASDPTKGALAKQLPRGGRLILCPNWSDTHVAYRCLSALAEELRTPNTRVLMIHDSDSGRAPATAWSDQTINVRLTPQGNYFGELAAIAHEIKSADLEFVFYPEVAPTNSTIYLATQRLARVQAAGYGFPIPTGSSEIDYFFVGQDVEGPNSRYNETLLTLPGMAVSTTAPPMPSRTRERSPEDPELRILTISTWQKLTPELIEAWEAIVGDQPHARIDAYASTLPNKTQLIATAAKPYFDKGRITIFPSVKRDVLLVALEDADLYLDTFPYGGFNSLVEVFCSGCPVLTLEGPEARHRFGAAMIRRLGLPDLLIAKSVDEFVNTARQLMQDAALRLDLRRQVGSRERVLAALDGTRDMQGVRGLIDQAIATRKRQTPAA